MLFRRGHGTGRPKAIRKGGGGSISSSRRTATEQRDQLRDCVQHRGRTAWVPEPLLGPPAMICVTPTTAGESSSSAEEAPLTPPAGATATATAGTAAERTRSAGATLTTLALMSSFRFGVEDDGDRVFEIRNAAAARPLCLDESDGDSSEAGDDYERDSDGSDRDGRSRASSGLSSVTDSFEDSCSVSSLSESCSSAEEPGAFPRARRRRPPPAVPAAGGDPRGHDECGAAPEAEPDGSPRQRRAPPADSPSVQAARYVSSLLTLSRTACGRSFILATGSTVPSLIEAMVRNGDDAEVQERGCRALMRLSRPSRGDVGSDAADGDGDGGDGDARTRSGLRDAIVSANGVRAILRGMRVHYGVGGVQAAACGALRNLATDADGENGGGGDDGGGNGGAGLVADIIAQEGGLRLVVRALTLRGPRTHGGAASAAVGALRALAGRVAAEDEELRAGAVDGIAEAMVRGGDGGVVGGGGGAAESLRAEGCAALRRLSARRPLRGGAGAAAAAAASLAVAAAMRAHPDAGTLQAEACAALYNLSMAPAGASALRRDRRRAKGALRGAAERFPDECGGYCRAVLYRMKRSGKGGRNPPPNRRRGTKSRVGSTGQGGGVGPGKLTLSFDAAECKNGGTHAILFSQGLPVPEKAGELELDGIERIGAMAPHAPRDVNETVSTLSGDGTSADEKEDDVEEDACSESEQCGECDVASVEKEGSSQQGTSFLERDGSSKLILTTNRGEAASQDEQECKDNHGSNETNAAEAGGTPLHQRLDSGELPEATQSCREGGVLSHEDGCKKGLIGPGPADRGTFQPVPGQNSRIQPTAVEPPRLLPEGGDGQPACKLSWHTSFVSGQEAQQCSQASEAQEAQGHTSVTLCVPREGGTRRKYRLLDECEGLEELEISHSGGHSVGRSTESLFDGKSVLASIDAARAGRADADKVEREFAYLREIAKDCPGSRLAIAGALLDLVDIISEHVLSEPIQREGCTLLADLCLSVDARMAVAAVGGISAVVVAMREHRQNGRIQAEACRALRNVCLTDGNLVLVKRDKRCAAALKRARKKFPQTCGAYCETLLKQIASCPKAVRHTLLLSVIEPGTDFRESVSLATLFYIHTLQHSADTLSEEHALVALDELGGLAVGCPSWHRGDNEKMRIEAGDHSHWAAVVAGGGIATIVAFMAKRLDSPFIQRAACTSLRNISIQDDENCHKAASAGCIDAVIAAMSMHPEDSEVQISGLALLQSLINVEGFNDITLETLHKAGGIVMVKDAMKVHRSNERVQEKACGVIFSFSQQRSIDSNEVARDCIRCIVSSLRAHPESKEVQQLGCGALYHLIDSSVLMVSLWAEEPEAVLLSAAERFPGLAGTWCQGILEKFASDQCLGLL